MRSHYLTASQSSRVTHRPQPGQVLAAGWLVAALQLGASASGQSAPPNDLFANATVITAPQAIVTGSNVGATKEPGEPNHAGNLGGQSVWWTWTAPTNGTVTLDTTGSSFDTLLAVYTGDSVSNLTLVAGNDDFNQVIAPALDVASTVTFSATAGTTYHIAVDGFAVSPFSRDSGNIVLGLWEGVMPPRIDTQPQEVTVPEGGVAGAYFQVNVSGTTPFGWQWFKDGVPIPSGSPLFPFRFEYQFGSAQLTNAGTYSVVVTNAGGSATSSNAVLTVLPVAFVAQPLVPPGTPQPQSMTVSAGYPVTFGAGAKSPAAVSYQWLKDGQPILGATNSTFTIANVQPGDAALYSVIASNALGSVTSSNATLTVLPPYTFVTFAGQVGVAGSNDGPGITARLNHPYGIAVDPAGSVFVGDDGNHSIRKITPTGVVSILANLGSSSGSYLSVAVDATNLYVADSVQRTISRIGADGTVSLFAGGVWTNNVEGPRDGTNTAALLRAPTALALDSAGNLFVSDIALRKVTPDGFVTTIAPGTGAGSYGPDGRWTKANLGAAGIGVDPAGRIFVADSHGSIRVIANGQVNTVAGLWNYPGHLDGSGSTARLAPAQPSGAAMDTGGNFYMVESPRGRSVRCITPRGDVTTLAGPSGAGDGTGAAAGFGFLGGIAVDRAGNLYVTDWGAHVVKKGVPFAITAWPQSQAVLEGASAALTAAADGPNGPFSYQWQFAGAPLAGETNATLSLGPVVRTNSGIYSVIVSNAVGNWITLNATVRALVPPVLQLPQLVTDPTTTNRTLRLFFQDADGGVPFDLSQLVLQWRTNLPSGTDTNWQTLTAGFYLTNGVVAVEDTNAVKAPTGFYRILER